jgi:hypothetical protein
MRKYEVTTAVEFCFEVEADSREAAEKEGWNYESYLSHGQVDCIKVFELEHTTNGRGN